MNTNEVKIGDEVELTYSGSERYGKVERIDPNGRWFTVACDGQYRTFRVANVTNFVNLTVGPARRLDNRPFRSIRVNSEND